MGKNFLLVIFSLLLFPLFCFADISYSRLPLGTSIASPIIVNVSADNFSDWGFVPEGINSFRPFLDTEWEGGDKGDCYTTSTLSFSTIFQPPPENLPENVIGIGLNGYTDNDCVEEVSGNSQTYLEGNGAEIIFTILGGANQPIMPSTTPFTLPANFLSDVYTASASFIAGYELPLALLFGIPLAMWGISWLLGRVGKKAKS